MEMIMEKPAAVFNDFQMDPALLVSVIKSQAGSLSKAITEGVMNSIDAGATSVQVTLTRASFSIEDNGRGFTSEEEIQKWFRRFGTPHAAGDATYGRFRMGRGQMMAFAKTVWRTGVFEMRVDLETKGMGFELSHLEDKVRGCCIQGELYKEMSEYSFTDTLSELKQYVAFTPVPVYVNGELYGATPSRLKSWTDEDEDAYYRLVPGDEDLLVYNQGIFVERMNSWRVGMGGVLVSKKPLEVNFARNSVMEYTCPVWGRIAAKLEGLVAQKFHTSRKLDDSGRKYLARRLRKLRMMGIDPLKTKVLTDPSGRHLTLGDLQSYKRIVYIEGEALACAVHGTDDTFVVNEALLTRFGVATVDEFLARVREVDASVVDGLEVIEQDVVNELGLGGSQLIELDGLTVKERAAFRALQWLNEQISLKLAVSGYGGETRRLQVGKHKATSFVAWTDGKTYITANKRYLKLFEDGLDGVLEWALTLVHEYQHDTDDSESHSHGEVFFRRFHDAAFSTRALGMGSLAQAGLVQYLKELTELGAPRPQTLTRQLKPQLH